MEFQINLIAEMAGYALGWQMDYKDAETASYDLGGIETTAHMIACCITQWFTNDSTDTGEVRDALELEGCPDKKKLKKLLTKFIKQL